MSEQNAADLGREAMRAASADRYIPEERTCLTITIYLHLNRATEESFRNGQHQLIQEIEESVKKNLPVAAIGRPPVVICWSQMPE
jgi:hypothetical protein